MSNKLTVVITLLFFQNIFSQTLRPNIQKLVDEIQKGNRLTSEYINYEGERSEQYDLCRLLDSLATKEELMGLVKYNSSVVKCAAFNTLCRLDIDYSKQTLLEHLNDYQEVKLQSGCISYTSVVADQFINSLRYHLTKNDNIFIVNLNKQILEDQNSKLHYKSILIRNLEINSENYELIRKLASQKKYTEAIICLAKYKNPKDIEIIISYFGNDETETEAIHAVKKFPDNRFYPYLVKVFKKEWRDRYYSYPKWRVLYQALAQYPNQEETLKLFDKTILAHNEFRRETLSKYLWIAATKYPNQKFEFYKSKIIIDKDDFLVQQELALD